MKKLKAILLLMLALFCLSANGQQSKQKIEMRLDSVGNAKLKISMTMNAQQWQMWLGSLGNNPAALKREIERALPAYFLDEFKLEKDDMNRSFTLTLNAYGVCEINKRGEWIVRTDQKDADVTELTDHKFMMVSSPPEMGGALQQTYILEFPSSAKKIKVDKDAFGETIFKFDMENPGGSGLNLLRWSGLAFILIGGVWSGKNLLTGKS
jgi:hypothetical protein